MTDIFKCKIRAVVGGEGALALPVFGISVNPYLNQGAHYPQPVLRVPSDFQALRRP